MHYLYLAVAIVAEVTATSALKAADGFSRLAPSIVVVAGYAVAFYFLSLTLRTMALGIAYAVWSGVGIALICVVGALLYKQVLDLPALIGIELIGIELIGIELIVAGVLVLNVYSRAITY